MPGAFTVLAGELDLQGELILQLRVAESERPLEKGSPLLWGAEATQDGLRARLPAPQTHPQAVSVPELRDHHCGWRNWSEPEASIPTLRT